MQWNANCGKSWKMFFEEISLQRKLSSLSFRSCQVSQQDWGSINNNMEGFSAAEFSLWDFYPKTLIFFGLACDMVADKKIKRSLATQFWRSWKSVKLDCVSYLQLSYIGNSLIKGGRSGAKQVFFTTSWHTWLLMHSHWHSMWDYYFCSPYLVVHNNKETRKSCFLNSGRFVRLICHGSCEWLWREMRSSFGWKRFGKILKLANLEAVRKKGFWSK